MNFEAPFALCADDFALTEGVSRAMLDLIDARRLTAVSALATAPAWPESAIELASRRGVVAIGLHLDLTLRPFGGGARPFGLGELIGKSLAHVVKTAMIAAEFERQFDAFEDALGFPPDHVDGHHHVHVLPQIRDALLRVLSGRYSVSSTALRPLIRDPGDLPRRIAARRGARGKALVVASLASGFAEAARAFGFETNVGFSGFLGRAPFDSAFAEVLKAPGPRHLVMCHPGFSGASLARLDRLTTGRDIERLGLQAGDGFPGRMLLVDRPRDSAGGAFARWGR
jgi:predicted glycoside hydrolase/deacetylase ChbG (UPF0249 family)